MEHTLTRIRNLYSALGRGEKKIADWLLKHPADLISLSISEVAAICGCGDATVIRFSKRLGLSGYQELKIKIARELGNNITGNLSFAKDDTVMDICNKHITDIKITLDDTRQHLNPESLKNAAIIDTLYTYIVLNGGEAISSAIHSTESALESKKY